MSKIIRYKYVSGEKRADSKILFFLRRNRTMKNRTYAKEITKDYLLKLGITDVTPDGLHIYKNGKEVPQRKTRSGKKKYYLSVILYDPELRQSIPVEERNSASGNITLGVHVVNYVWNSGKDKAAGIVIDHEDNDPFNNHITNLKPKTQKANLHKEHKDWCTGQLKCKLNKPLSFYEDKLSHYLALHDEAYSRGDKEACHKLRVNISQTRKRINYYNAHIDEANAIKAEQEKAEAEKLAKKEAKEKAKLEEQAKKDAYHGRAARLRELEMFVLAARSQYMQAEYEYGPDHLMTVCAKREWRAAVAERNEFLGIKNKNDGF